MCFVFCSSSLAIQFEVWDPSVGYIPFTAPAHSLLTLAWNTHWPLTPPSLTITHMFSDISLCLTHIASNLLLVLIAAWWSIYDFYYYILSQVISLVTYIKFNWLISCFLHWLFCWELAWIMNVMNSLRGNVTGFNSFTWSVLFISHL